MKYILNLIIVFFVLISCSKMDDVYSEYVTEGEDIYASVPYDIMDFSGNKRIKLSYILRNAGNVNKCMVEWDNGNGKQVFDVSPKLPIDTISMIIDNLEERDYTFILKMEDSFGNVSVKKEIVATVFGEKFQASLSPRIIGSMVGGNTVDSIVIDWIPSNEKHVGVLINYENTAGVPMQKEVGRFDSRTVIRDWKPLSTLTYTSYYIPKPRAIDTFEVAAELELPDRIDFTGEMLDNSEWEIVDFSSEENAEAQWSDYDYQGKAEAAIDGILETFWHTQWDAAQPDYPHYFTFDLKKTAAINKIACYRRQGDDRGQIRFKISSSLNGVDFTEIGTYNYDNTIDNQNYDIPITTARYIKYEALEGGEFFAFLAEIELQGNYLSSNLVPTSDISILDLSSEENAEAQWSDYDYQGKVEAAFDGLLETFWHTQWDADQPNYPHYFTLELANEIQLSAIESFRRQGDDRGQTKFRIETSTDNVTWESQGEFDLNASSDEGQLYYFTFQPSAKYIRYTALEGPEFFAFMAEMNIYGE
ncbi:DUF4998 domain-containing protein [Portibacter lacus]|nr:DUF4998 domain-containing protein [Portibacter lacus]